MGVMRRAEEPDPSVVRLWVTPASGLILCADERFADNFGVTNADIAGRAFSTLGLDMEVLDKWVSGGGGLRGRGGGGRGGLGEGVWWGGWGSGGVCVGGVPRGEGVRASTIPPSEPGRFNRSPHPPARHPCIRHPRAHKPARPPPCGAG